jgi:hypothetical protein
MIKNIVGKPVPVDYIDRPFGERWSIFEVKSGKYKGESVCLAATYKDEKSLVELPYSEDSDESFFILIDNKDLGFDLEKHLETNRLLEEMNKDLTKESNPKDAVGIKKVSFSCVPTNVIGEIALGLMEGARKYGRHNYRVVGVRGSVYYDAALRHLNSWLEGEDIDPDSGLSHISKALSCLVVLRDAMMNDNWNDDRPPKVKNQNWVKEMNEKAAEIIKKYPEGLEPYTEINNAK